MNLSRQEFVAPARSMGAFFVVMVFLSTPVCAADDDGKASKESAVDAGVSMTSPEVQRPPSKKRRSLGPFVIRSEAGGTLRLSGATQLRLNAEGDDLERGLRDVHGALSFQRLRLSLTGLLLEKRLGYKLQLNLSPTQPEIIDVIGSYVLAPSLILSLGQFKIPFTAYREQSFATLELADWGETSRWFGAERQLGATIRNAREEDSQLKYAVGFFHGQNSRAAFSTRLRTTVYGEEARNPSLLSSPSKYQDPHPEMVGRVLYQTSDFRWWENSDVGRGSLRALFGLSAAYDMAPVVTEDATLRFATEVLVKVRGLSLNAIYYSAFTTLSEYTEGGGTVLGYHGPQFEAAYRLDRFWEISARYGYVHIGNRLNEDARTRADAILSTSSGDTSDALRDRYATAGRVKGEHEISLGVNAYIVGNSLKWQTDASLLPVKLTFGDRFDYRGRTQLQLAF